MNQWDMFRGQLDMRRGAYGDYLSWQDEVSLRASVLRPYCRNDDEAWYAARQWAYDDWYAGGQGEYPVGRIAADAAAWTEWFALVALPWIFNAVWRVCKWTYLVLRAIVGWTAMGVVAAFAWFVENVVARWAVRRVAARCKRGFGDENWAWRAAMEIKHNPVLVRAARRWAAPEVNRALDVLRAGPGKTTWEIFQEEEKERSMADGQKSC